MPGTARLVIEKKARVALLIHDNLEMARSAAKGVSLLCREPGAVNKVSLLCEERRLSSPNLTAFVDDHS